MSESTYFLDLKNSSILRSINNRLASMDTTLRIFPQTGYQMLRSSNITSYNDAEWNAQEQTLETGSVINTGNDANVFITGRGTTNWTNSSIQMKYTKYSTGKFDAEFIVNINGTNGFDFRDDTYEFWNYAFFIPSYLIKNADGDSIQITSYTDIFTCQKKWKVPGEAYNKWYGSKQSNKPDAYLCILIGTVTTNASATVNITNGRIYLSGSYNMNLDNT